MATLFALPTLMPRSSATWQPLTIRPWRNARRPGNGAPRRPRHPRPSCRPAPAARGTARRGPGPPRGRPGRRPGRGPGAPGRRARPSTVARRRAGRRRPTTSSPADRWRGRSSRRRSSRSRTSRDSSRESRPESRSDAAERRARSPRLRSRNRAHHLLGDVELLVGVDLHVAAFELRIVLEVDLDAEALLQLGEAARLLLDEVERHLGVHLERDALLGADRRDPAHGALELDQHGLVGRHLAEAAAMRAVLGVVVEQARALALPRHLDQAQIGHRERLGARAVLAQLRAQLLQHRSLVALDLHVDEVDDDDAADVAQAQLPRDLARGFDVGAEDGLLLVLLAGEASGVDVDRHQRLGVVDADVATLLEPHLALERLLDLRLDLVVVEDRIASLVELDAIAQLGRHALEIALDLG